MRRTIPVVLWVVFCSVLTIGAALAQDKYEIEELKEQAKAQWEQLLAKCGESYLYKGDRYSTLHEYRDVSLKETPRSLTEADKLNGIRWAGLFILKANASRKQGMFTGKWGKWKDGGNLEFRAKNVNGQWHFRRRQFVFRWIPVTHVKPSCNLLKN